MSTGPTACSGSEFPGSRSWSGCKSVSWPRRGRSIGLAIRWEATGPSGGLFPVLDADLTVAPYGERITILAIAGAYRPPLGAAGAALDRAILHRMAEATIRAFLAQVARRITGQPATNGAGTGPPSEGTTLP
jgi:hypothetical protein